MGGTRKDRSDLRIVVQYAHGDIDSPWRLVAYGSGRSFRPRRFRSLEDLLAVIRSAVPDFAPSQLAAKRDFRESHIVWAGDMALDESQVSCLDLGSDTGSKS